MTDWDCLLKTQILNIPNAVHFPLRDIEQFINRQSHVFYKSQFVQSDWIPPMNRTAPCLLNPHMVFIKQITIGVYLVELLHGKQSLRCVMKVTCIDEELAHSCGQQSLRYGQQHDCLVMPGAWVEVAAWARMNENLLITHANLQICNGTNCVVMLTKALHSTWHDTLSRYMQLDPFPPVNLTYADVVLASLAQIYLCTLGVAHYHHDICHNDLKTDNLMYYKSSLFGFVFVRYGNVTLRIPTYGRVFVLIDMAFSSIRYDSDHAVCSITPLWYVQPQYAFQAFQRGTDVYQISSCMSSYFGELIRELSHTNSKWGHVINVMQALLPVTPERTEEETYIHACQKSFPRLWDVFVPYFQFDGQIPGEHHVLVFE